MSALAQIAGRQAQVTAIEHQGADDRIRVVVHFDRPVRFVEGTAVDPYRIFFDLQGARPAGALASITAVGDPILRRIRVAQYQPGITRVVLDMDRPAPYSAAFLSDPPRLVVEISRTAALAQARTVAAPASTPTPAVAPPAPAAAAISQLAASRTPPAGLAPLNQGKPSDSLVTPPATPAPPAAKAQAPTGSLAPSDSKLAARFGAGASGDPSTLLQAAQHGDPNAQFQMADLYMTGRGVGRDPVCGRGHP